MLWERIRYFFATVGGVLTALCVLFSVWALGATRFPFLQGEHTYYLRSKSSQALIKRELSPFELSLVQGESVQLRYQAGLIEEILEELSAEVVFVERSGSTSSYYCVTDAWTDGVLVGEHFINLHIARSGNSLTVGAPIIFGGF